MLQYITKKTNGGIKVAAAVAEGGVAADMICA